MLVYARVRAGISIHALRKESDGIFANIRCFGVISIHALRKESDNLMFDLQTLMLISIHALRKESDRPESGVRHAPEYFNPRSP